MLVPACSLMEVDLMNERSDKAAEEFQAALQQVEQLFDTASATPELAPWDVSDALGDGEEEALPSPPISDQDEPTRGAL